MLLQITRHTGKPQIISYQRDDGTATWMKADNFFVQHDISHYAIEKTLGYTGAFMGMLNSGMDIRDFEDREKRLRLTVTREACYAENMANLFLIDAVNGNFDNFNEVLAASFVNMQQAFDAPVLTNTEVDAVRQCLKDLLTQWTALAPEETMILHFET
jgi:hypothetical protein